MEQMESDLRLENFRDKYDQFVQFKDGADAEIKYHSKIFQDFNEQTELKHKLGELDNTVHNEHGITSGRVMKLDQIFRDLDGKIESANQMQLNTKLLEYKNKFEKLVDVLLSEKKIKDLEDTNRPAGSLKDNALVGVSKGWNSTRNCDKRNTMALSQCEVAETAADDANVKQRLQGKLQSWLDLKDIESQDINAHSILDSNAKNRLGRGVFKGQLVESVSDEGVGLGELSSFKFIDFEVPKSVDNVSENVERISGNIFGGTTNGLGHNSNQKIINSGDLSRGGKGGKGVGGPRAQSKDEKPFANGSKISIYGTKMKSTKNVASNPAKKDHSLSPGQNRINSLGDIGGSGKQKFLPRNISVDVRNLEAVVEEISPLMAHGKNPKNPKNAFGQSKLGAAKSQRKQPSSTNAYFPSETHNSTKRTHKSTRRVNDKSEYVKASLIDMHTNDHYSTQPDKTPEDRNINTAPTKDFSLAKNYKTFLNQNSSPRNTNIRKPSSPAFLKRSEPNLLKKTKNPTLARLSARLDPGAVRTSLKPATKQNDISGDS